MPEGSELAHSRDFLQRLIGGKHLNTFEIVGGRYKDSPPEGYEAFKAALAQQPMLIDTINVKGKFMWWGFFADERTPWHMWCTYGMSGRWTTEPRDEHTAASATVIGVNQMLNFRDPRHFGTLKFVNNNDKTTKKLASLGPDMLNNPPSTLVFIARAVILALTCVTVAACSWRVVQIDNAWAHPVCGRVLFVLIAVLCLCCLWKAWEDPFRWAL